MINQTKHSDNCNRVFKNYDLNCPRCLELANGSQPRKGWQEAYFSNKAKTESVKTSSCEHGISEINPGGYCNICGSGRDFS